MGDKHMNQEWIGKCKPTPAELKAYAHEQGFEEDYTHCVNLLTGERVPWCDEQIQKWIDQAWET